MYLKRWWKFLNKKLWLILAIISFIAATNILLVISFFEFIGKITQRQMLLYSAFDLPLYTLTSVFMCKFLRSKLKFLKYILVFWGIWAFGGTCILLIDYYTHGALQNLL